MKQKKGVNHTPTLISFAMTPAEAILMQRIVQERIDVEKRKIETASRSPFDARLMDVFGGGCMSDDFMSLCDHLMFTIDNVVAGIR